MKNLKKTLSLVLCLIMVVGLLPTMALAESSPPTVIDEIHIGGVTMPVVGATPINSATTSTPGVTIGSDTFWVRYVPETNDLKDIYDDSTYVDSTPFRSGIKYSLQVMLEPQNSCTIAADAKIFYNGIQLPAPDISDPSKSCAMVVPDGTRAMALISGEASVPTTYTVTFESDGGSAVTAQTVEEGKTATKPADPTKEGYTFKGWTLDGAAYDFATPVTGNITLKAKWEAVVVPPTTYTVTFDSDGGSTVAAQTVEEGKTATKPADPTREGYTFQGWYLGETAYDFATPVTGNFTLKAKWEKIETPTDPTEPSKPNDPNEPTEPGKPTDPTDPTEPSKPTTPTTPTNPETPKTGDNSNMFLWIAMLFASFFGVVMVLVLGKKNTFAR